jgi:hypothetical protein
MYAIAVGGDNAYTTYGDYLQHPCYNIDVEFIEANLVRFRGAASGGGFTDRYLRWDGSRWVL